MRITHVAAVAALTLAAGLATPVLARSGGSGGGDRERAGGASTTSAPDPGSPGIQKYGPPRSVDVPRPGYPYGSPYGYPDTTGSLRHAPGYYSYGR